MDGDAVNEEEIALLIDRAMSPLQAEVTRLNDELNLYKQSGLDALRTRALAYHNVPYVTDQPTETDEFGSPRVVQTGTGPNTYEAQWYTPDGWLGAALS